MKKSQLKQTLKPLIKECIKEVFLEQGMLSGIIAEVVKGTQPLREQRQRTPTPLAPESDALKFQQQQLEEQRHSQIKEQKEKLLNATGLPSNVFEGVKPLGKGGNPDIQHEGGTGPLSDVDPHDPGIDISGIMAVGGHKWDKLI